MIDIQLITILIIGLGTMGLVTGFMLGITLFLSFGAIVIPVGIVVSIMKTDIENYITSRNKSHGVKK